MPDTRVNDETVLELSAIGIAMLAAGLRAGALATLGGP